MLVAGWWRVGGMMIVPLKYYYLVGREYDIPRCHDEINWTVVMGIFLYTTRGEGQTYVYSVSARIQMQPSKVRFTGIECVFRRKLFQTGPH